jgi:flagellar basal-body rod modification protein FlgD
MSVTGTSSIDRTSATGLGGPTSNTGAAAFDSQSFMRLLIAQIQHQDPLQPMDASQMTQQLTQLTSVERLVSIDGQLGALSVATASVANAQAADLVGRDVQADTSHILLSDGSPGEGTFELPTAATHSTVEIRDGHGTVVRTLSIDGSAAGAVPFTWDGHDEAGNRCASGSYTIAVHASDADGNAIDATTRVHGVVTAVTYDNGYPELTVGGAHVVLGDVRSIGPAPVAPSAPPTTP